MGKTAKVVNEDLTKEDLENIKFDVSIEEEKEDHVGIPIVERRKADQIKEFIDIPVGYEKKIMIEGQSKEETLVLYKYVPGIIDPNKYYPVLEWRITQDTVDDADIWPEWKGFDVAFNGQAQRGGDGRVLTAQCFIYRSIQEMDENQDGLFFSDPPFACEFTKMSDVGIPVILGSEIEYARSAMRGGTVGATRRRGE